MLNANVEMRAKRFNAWVQKGVLPSKTNCEICGRVIFLNSGKHRTSIHFDHRHEGKEKIKILPSHWLFQRRPTPENIAIWKSCDFGMLCYLCNRLLPTLGRNDFIQKVLKYLKRRN